MQVAYPFCLIKRFRLGVCGCYRHEDIPIRTTKCRLRYYISHHHDIEPRKMVKCKCGCGEEFINYNKYNQKREYLKGHHVKKPVYKIKCLCGCGQTLLNRTKRAKKRKYIPGHHNRMKDNVGLWKVWALHNCEICGRRFYDEKHHDRRSCSLRCSRNSQAFPRKDTKIEIKMQESLKRLNIDFEKHRPMLGQPDIFISPNICIFVDGEYWHSRIKRIWYDYKVDSELEKRGMKVIRLWGDDIKNHIDWCNNLIISIRGR